MVNKGQDVIKNYNSGSSWSSRSNASLWLESSQGFTSSCHFLVESGNYTCCSIVLIQGMAEDQNKFCRSKFLSKLNIYSIIYRPTGVAFSLVILNFGLSKINTISEEVWNNYMETLLIMVQVATTCMVKI